MAAPTESIDAIVLRRTKLGESDVIVTLLAEDGSQYKAVAKGARKPTSSFASRLEVYAISTLMLAKGKNLDIVKEARLIEANAALRSDFYRSSAAAPIVELLARATLQDQETPRLFDLSRASLSHLTTTQLDPLVITAAAILKILGFLGFRPSFAHCIDCGEAIDANRSGSIAFSYYDGGVLCSSDASCHETTLISSEVLAWCDRLLYSTLEDISHFQVPSYVLNDIFTLLREWIHVHLGVNLRSLNYLFKNVLSPR